MKTEIKWERDQGRTEVGEEEKIERSNIDRDKVVVGGGGA